MNKDKPQSDTKTDGKDNPDDRSLDYLIYDGMGQVRDDGTVIGSIRP